VKGLGDSLILRARLGALFFCLFLGVPPFDRGTHAFHNPSRHGVANCEIVLLKVWQPGADDARVRVVFFRAAALLRQGGSHMALKIFRERSRTALHFSGSVVPCLIGERLFRHSLGISPPPA
jgi:hypothetical protein